MRKYALAALMLAASSPAMADHIIAFPHLDTPQGIYASQGECEVAAAEKRAEFKHYNRYFAHECVEGLTDLETGETVWHVIWSSR